ncbi:MAG: prefoldin subunit beta [Candidatus Thermoplasmatota archaeon]|nr:prefoldin subunit beta [Candidatus Thermoplasmatota archaeon]
MMDNLPPKVQNQIAQFQQLAQQIQMITSQKLQFDAQVRELDKAIAELDKAGDAVVYRNIGSLMIQSKDNAVLATELKDQKETLEVRVKTLDRQDKQLRERHQGLQEQITKALNVPSPEGEGDEKPKAG